MRILLLDPDSQAALQRAEELDPVDVRGLIRENLQHLHAFPDSGLLSVRVYDASVSESGQWSAGSCCASIRRRDIG